MLDSAVARTDRSRGEAQNGGLQGFLSSMFSTLDSVFGVNISRTASKCFYGFQIGTTTTTHQYWW